ncbi:MAG TPA: hypothetical protein V6C97_31345 [Oculatellaceae cyanobacterium]
MKKQWLFTLLLAANAALPLSASAIPMETAKPWQVQSLKGIETIYYAVNYDPEKKYINQLANQLAPLKLKMKPTDFKDEPVTTLSPSEALVKLVVATKENGTLWVGLYVSQRSQLARNSSVQYEAQTYKIGTLGSKEKVNDAIKDLCTELVHDFALARK